MNKRNVTNRYSKWMDKAELKKKVLFWAVNKRGPEKHTFVNKSQGVQALES